MPPQSCWTPLLLLLCHLSAYSSCGWVFGPQMFVCLLSLLCCLSKQKGEENALFFLGVFLSPTAGEKQQMCFLVTSSAVASSSLACTKKSYVQQIFFVQLTLTVVLVNRFTISSLIVSHIFWGTVFLCAHTSFSQHIHFSSRGHLSANPSPSRCGRKGAFPSSSPKETRRQKSMNSNFPFMKYFCQLLCLLWRHPHHCTFFAGNNFATHVLKEEAKCLYTLPGAIC